MTGGGTIACLTLQPGARAGLHEAQVNGTKLSWEMIPVAADIERLRGELNELLQRFDAVAIDGVTSSFRIGDANYRHEAIWNALNLSSAGSRFSDGSGLRATLERYLTRLAADQLEPDLRNASILIFSGLTRYGVADVLANYSKRLVFGDLLYGFRLGIPIDGLKSFVHSAPNLVRAVGSTPASWYWPSARRSKRVMPRFQFFFRRAKVIVGDIAYFERYAPPRLDGKIVFTNLNSDDEIDYFRQVGVKTVVSLTPMLDGMRIPLPVLDAFLSLTGVDRVESNLEDHLINRIHQLGFKPQVIHFGTSEDDRLALIQLPSKQPAIEPTPDAEVVQPQPAADVGRFAFVIHPLNFHQIKRLKVVEALSTFLPERLLEDAAAQAPPFLCGRLLDVTSASGAKAEGLIYAVPMTSRAIMRFPPEFLYKKLLWIADDAAKKGCLVMGLGAYTSVVGDAGVTVSKQSPIGITSGNSYTVAATLLTLESAAERCGLALVDSAALVIGATGSIGSICARLLAKRVKCLYLVSPRPERLLALSDQIEAEVPALKGKIQLSRTAADFLGKVKVVVTTTSAVEPVVDVTALQPGCVVCDVARPPDIKPEAAAKRDDILVVDSGEIQLPAGARLTVDVGLPPGTIYACLAETLLLGLEQHRGHYTLGRAIDPARVEEITAIGRKHGFELAELRSFGKQIPAGRFERLQHINRTGQF